MERISKHSEGNGYGWLTSMAGVPFSRKQQQFVDLGISKSISEQAGLIWYDPHLI